MRIGYVIETFPKLSETFILRELREMQRQGDVVHVYAVRETDDPLDFPAAECAREVYYAPHCLSWEALRADLHFFLTRWAGHYHQYRMVRELYAAPLSLVKHVVKHDTLARAFARRMERDGVDRVHAHFAGVPAFMGMIAAQLLGVNFSFSAHARDVFVRPAMIRWKAESADRVLTCNEAARARLMELLPPGLHSRIHLVHHGLDLESIGPLREPQQADVPCILSVGRLEPKKGLDDLLRALRQLQEDGRPFRAEIIGDGPEREHLERLSRDMGLRSDVAWLGALRPSEVLDRMRRADALLLPSKLTPEGDRDGIPNVVLEAAAVGLPVIGTTVGGIPEFIRHGETGLLARPDDPRDLASQIRRALDSPEETERMVRAARTQVETHFELRKNVGEIRRLFESPSRVH